MKERINKEIKNEYIAMLPFIFAIIGGIYFTYGYFEHYKSQTVLSDTAMAAITKISNQVDDMSATLDGMKTSCQEVISDVKAAAN